MVLGSATVLLASLPLQAERASIEILGAFFGGNGTGPYGGLLAATDGFYYGTTHQGGSFGLPFGYGTIFRINAAGGLQTLHSFNQTDGARPYASLTQGPEGSLYGTTLQGGSANLGTVFRWNTNGTLTTLHHFNGNNGARPSGRLALTSNGDLIGTTQSGGAYNLGTVFQISSNGNLITLASCDGTNGANPYAGVIQVSEGNFLSTAVNGGQFDLGTVFKTAPGGVISAVISFQASNGANPYGGLVKAPHGDFYGTTAYGGTENYGTLFQINSNGGFQLLHHFTGGLDGANPWATLTCGPDGYLYGTTILGGQDGGAAGWGTVYQCSTNGMVTPLFAFGVNSNGISPYGELAFDATGRLYGTTFSLGTGLKGTAFRLAVGSPRLIPLVDANEFRIQCDVWPGKTYQLERTTNLISPDWTAIGQSLQAASGLMTWQLPRQAGQELFRVESQ